MLALGIVIFAYPQDREMTYDDYLTELNGLIAREKSAREGIAQEQAAIENLKQHLARVMQRTAEVRREMYAILGVTEQDVIDAESELASLLSIFREQVVLSDEELLGRRAQIDRYESRFNALRQKRVCLLYRVAARVNEVEAVLSQIRAQIDLALNRSRQTAAVSYSTYTVGGSGTARTLWDIASEVYNDKFQWPRIYRANRPRIDRAFQRYLKSAPEGIIRKPQDFVLPGWTLEIPR